MASIDLTSPCKLVAVQMPYSHFHWFCHILSGKDLGQEGSGAGEYFDRFGGPRDEDGRRVLEEVGREIQHLMADERHGQLRRRHVRLLRKTSRFDSVACLASMYGFSMLAFFFGFHQVLLGAIDFLCHLHDFTQSGRVLLGFPFRLTPLTSIPTMPGHDPLIGLLP